MRLFLLTVAFSLVLSGINESISGTQYSTKISGDTLKKATVEVKMGAILNVGITTVTCGGILKTDNKLSRIQAHGLCWNTKPGPLVKDNKISANTGDSSFICKINSLFPKTFYFIRPYAITEDDTIYGDQKIFYTHKTDAVADIDGNYYNSIRIGTQVWLAEDLKTVHLNDGLPIARVADYSIWSLCKDPAWCWYANDSVNYSFPRGRLYNWYTVNTGKICPVNWHVPSNAEWTILQDYLGGQLIAGGKLKTTGTFFWRTPNKDATDESGFSAIPGGYRSGSGKFFYSSIVSNWWSTDSVPPGAAYNWHVNHEGGLLYHEFNFKILGYSVRCLKD